MDPDMVRQQEEAEAASRIRRPTPMGAANSQIAARAAAGLTQSHARDAPFVLRADPRENLTATPPLAPVRPVGWGVVMQASVLGLTATALAAVAGFMLGVKLGLLPWQSLAIGAAAAFILGWLSATVALRRHGIPLGRAARASIMPTALILFALLTAMAVAALFNDISPATLSDHILPTYWINVGVGALIGLLFAVMRMRGNLNR